MRGSTPVLRTSPVSLLFTPHADRPYLKQRNLYNVSLPHAGSTWSDEEEVACFKVYPHARIDPVFLETVKPVMLPHARIDHGEDLPLQKRLTRMRGSTDSGPG